MGHFFNVAKKKLNVEETSIHLVVGKTTFSAENTAQKFFRLLEVQDAIGERVEVNIYVVRVHHTVG